MTTSRRTRSGRSFSTTSSASLPSFAVTTSYPWGASTASRRRTFAGTSSMTGSLGRGSATIAVLPDDLDQLEDVDRLRQIPVESSFEEAFAIAAHGLRRQGQHGDGSSVFVAAHSRERLHAVDAGQVHVHQHDGGTMFPRKLHGDLAGGCLARAVTRRPENIPEELHVHLVVLDHQDEFRRHGGSPAWAA